MVGIRRHNKVCCHETDVRKMKQKLTKIWTVAYLLAHIVDTEGQRGQLMLATIYCCRVTYTMNGCLKDFRTSNEI